MVIDGFVLPDREMVFDPKFDLLGCLQAFHSFLRNYRLAGKSFDVFLKEVCKEKNVNIRLILPLLQMGSGLLNRKQEPNFAIPRRGVLLPAGCSNNGMGLDGVLVKCIGEFRILYERANLVEPLQLKDGVVLPKTRISYAVLSYVRELGKADYPDSGCYLYLRHFNQIGRFLKRYAI